MFYIPFKLLKISVFPDENIVAFDLFKSTKRYTEAANFKKETKFIFNDNAFGKIIFNDNLCNELVLCLSSTRSNRRLNFQFRRLLPSKKDDLLLVFK